MEWVTSPVGPFQVDSHFAHGHGYSKLWRLMTSTRPLWLKLHTYPGKWAGEVHALLNWASQTVPSPEVVGYRDQPPSLLMSEVPGTIATEIELGREAEMRLWRQAGQYLAELHRKRNAWFGAALPNGSP